MNSNTTDVLSKLVIPLLVLVGGFFLNRLLERHKREQATLLEEFKAQQSTLLETFRGQQSLALETFRAERSLENELDKVRDAKRLAFLERQLSEFYWPIFTRLSIDNAVWERILDAKNGSDDVRRRVGREIERTLILSNHEQIVRIMESSMHLAGADEADLGAMLKYIRHIAVYRALRATGIEDVFPLKLGEPWPSGLFERVRERTLALQREYDATVQTLASRETRTEKRSGGLRASTRLPTPEL